MMLPLRDELLHADLVHRATFPDHLQHGTLWMYPHAGSDLLFIRLLLALILETMECLTWKVDESLGERLEVEKEEPRRRRVLHRRCVYVEGPLCHLRRIVGFFYSY